MGSALDLRLLVPALGLWIGSALTMWWQANLWIPIFVSLIALGGFRWCWPQHFTVLFAIVIVGILSSLIRLLPLSVDFSTDAVLSEFVVTTDPVARTAVGSANFEKTYSLRADVVMRGDSASRIPMILSFTEPSLRTAIPTSRWRCELSLQSTYLIHRYAAFGRCRSTPEIISGPSRYQAFATSLRNALADITYRHHPSDDSAALLPALVDGDTRGQSSHLSSSLQQAGLGHVTAVSGANVAILFAALHFVLLRLRVSSRARLAIQVVALVVFVILARPTPSVVRAAVMAFIALLYWWIGWRRYGEVVVLVTVVFLLAVDPWLAVSWGFVLSVAATFALVVLPSLWGTNQGNKAQQLLATAFAATLATIPLLIAMGAQPTFASIPANVVADIFIAPATIAGFICLICAALAGLPLVGGVFEFFASVSCFVGMLFARAIIWIAETLNRTSLSTSVVSFSGFLAIAVVVTIAYRLRHLATHRLLIVGLLALTVVITLIGRIENWTSQWPLANWDVVACDVGQGDASIVRTGAHSALVIDSGGDAQLMDECLRNLEINVVDVFIASHFHADHVGGIAGLVQGRHVRKALLPPQQVPTSGYEAVQRNIANYSIARIGESGEVNSVKWKVLFVGSPIGDTEDGSVINNSSIVILVTIHQRTILFTGDLEIEGQSQLMTQLGQLHVDVVKIPHHGSRFQAPAFASWLHPAIAWVSVGVDNPYGHPALETLNSYRATGAIVVATRDCGSVALRLGTSIEWRGSRACHA